MSFEEVAAALDAWIGEPVEVLIGPSPNSPVFPELDAGTVYGALFGTLRQSDHGAVWGWRGPGAPSVGTIAFQVGDEPNSYFAVHPDLLTAAEWISREHRFLEVEMGTIKIGVSIYHGR